MLFGIASSRGQVSVASVLGSLYPVATIVLARIVVGERLRRVQRVGVVLALGGAVVIAHLTAASSVRRTPTSGWEDGSP